MELVIGTPMWSTWSMRPWLVMRHAGAEFIQTVIPLRQDEATAEAIAPHSPSGQVPALKDAGLVIWDSLAICEYLAEKFPRAGLWPDDSARRALGRAAAAEMHSGFMGLRSECPMDLSAAPAAVQLSALAQKNVRRIAALWNDLLDRHGGPFLLEDWSIADAFFTPLATRLRTYHIDLGDYGDEGGAAEYATRLLQTPEFLAWEAMALGDVNG